VLKKVKLFFKNTCVQLFKINDSPQKVALGFGLGVFLGIFPGTGVLAAIFCAWALRLNRASALLGSLMTNTWLSIVTFLLSVKVGSVIMNLRWKDVQQGWQEITQHFSWANLFKFSGLKVILPVIVGYTVIGFCIGLVLYIITLILLLRLKNARKG